MRPGMLARTSNPDQQRTFIMENEGILNKTTMLSIIHLVLMAVTSREKEDMKKYKDSIITEPRANEVVIDLQNLYELLPDTLQVIYNMVYSRRDALNKPLCD